MAQIAQSTAGESFPRVLVQVETLDTEFRLAVHLGKVILENRFGHVDRGENVGDQTDGQRDGETTDRSSSKKEQEERGDDRGDVRVDNGQESFVESGLDGDRGRFASAQFFANTF